MAKDQYRHLTKEDIENIQMAGKYIKSHLTYAIRELQIKKERESYHYTPVRLAKIQNPDKPNTSKDGTIGTLIHC